MRYLQSDEWHQRVGTEEISPSLLVLLGDMEQITGAARLSQQFVRSVRKHVPPSALTVLPLDEAVGWYWGAYPKTAFRSDSRRARLGRNVRYSLNVIQVGLAQRPCFVFCLSSRLSVLSFLLKRLVGSEYAIYEHDLRAWSPRSKLIKKSIENASWVVVNSRDTKTRVLERLSIDLNRILILPPPVDGGRFRPTERKESLVKKYGLKGHKVLLCVGRLAPAELDGKGYLAVIRVLPGVLSRLPMVKLLIIGSGDGQRQLYDLAAGLGVQDHIVFAGRIPDEQMCDHYNLCDLFVLPSVQEGFGMVYTEALACGKPVIGGAVRGALDALLDGRLGILVNPGDAHGLADAIVRMLQGDVEPHLLDPIYLRKTVLAHYGFDLFTERVGTLLETMLGRSLK